MLLFLPSVPLSHPFALVKHRSNAISQRLPPPPSPTLSLHNPRPQTKHTSPPLVHTPPSFPSLLSLSIKSLPFFLLTLPLPSLSETVLPTSDRDDPINQGLFKVVVALLFIASFNVIFLTIDNFLTSRRDRIDREIIRLKLEEDPKRVFMNDNKPPQTKNQKKTRSPSNDAASANRQTRRYEKKIKDREERALKRKQSLQKQSTSSQKDSSETN